MAQVLHGGGAALAHQGLARFVWKNIERVGVLENLVQQGCDAVFERERYYGAPVCRRTLGMKRIRAGVTFVPQR